MHLQSEPSVYGIVTGALGLRMGRLPGAQAVLMPSGMPLLYMSDVYKLMSSVRFCTLRMHLKLQVPQGRRSCAVQACEHLEGDCLSVRGYLRSSHPAGSAGRMLFKEGSPTVESALLQGAIASWPGVLDAWVLPTALPVIQCP